MKITRTYDTSNRITLELTETWSGSAWENNKKKAFTYTAIGNDLQIDYLYETWSTTNNVWENNSKQQVIVNANNDITYREFYGWNNSQSAWVGNYKYSFSYNNNTVENLITSWDYSSNNWYNDPLNKVEYNYDTNFTYNDLLLPNDFTYSSISDIFFPDFLPNFNKFRNKLIEMTYYGRSSVNDPWQPSTKRTYLYSSSVSNISELNNLKASVYPNPFTENIIVEAEEENFEVAIFDISGKIVYQNKHMSGDIIPIEYLERGMYMYQIKANDKIKTGKILKH
jgi:hypothetical protein